MYHSRTLLHCTLISLITLARSAFTVVVPSTSDATISDTIEKTTGSTCAKPYQTARLQRVQNPTRRQAPTRAKPYQTAGLQRVQNRTRQQGSHPLGSRAPTRAKPYQTAGTRKSDSDSTPTRQQRHGPPSKAPLLYSATVARLRGLQ